ncbi:MAG: cupin domain-containing protein [Acidobacteriota bacterium]
MDETESPLEAAERFSPDAMQFEQLEMAAAIAMLGLSTSPVQPPARVKKRLMDSVRGMHEESGTPSSDAINQVRPGVSLLRTRVLPWAQHSSPGVRIKDVSADPISGARCLLLELSPGSVFPDHEHEGVEEVFVVRGSFSVAGQVVRTGDFCRSEPGTRDWDITSEEGALLLVTLGPPRRPLAPRGVDEP